MVFFHTKSSVLWAKTLSLCVLAIPVSLMGLDRGKALGATPSHGESFQSIELPRQIAQATDAQKEKARQLYEQGRSLYLSGNYVQGEIFLQRALTIYRKLKYRGYEAEILSLLVDLLFQDGRAEAARQILTEELAIYRQLMDYQGERGVLSSLIMDAETRLQDYRKATDYQQRLLVILRELKDRSNEMFLLYGLGDNFYKLGDYQKSIIYANQTLILARQLENLKDKSSPTAKSLAERTIMPG
jgi:tetratricopeptide (TPR) repeat protein